MKPEPPAGLTAGQAEIFRFIVDGLAAGEILGRMDVFALESTAVAVDRLRTINGMIDEDPDLLLNSALQQSGEVSERSVAGVQRTVPVAAGQGKAGRPGRAKGEGEQGPPGGGPGGR